MSDHLTKLNSIFNKVKSLNEEDLYVYLLKLEKDYVNGAANNFALMVHQLSPLAFEEDKQKLFFIRQRKCTDKSIFGMMKCPFCSVALPAGSAYKLHIKKAKTTCASCSEDITCEAIRLAIFVDNFNRGDYIIKSSFDLGTKLTITTKTSSWKSFSAYLLEIVKKNKRILALPKSQQRFRAINLRWEVREIIATLRSNFSCLSIDLIKGMYRQLAFVNKICSNYVYWSDTSLIHAAISRYLKFLELIANYPGKTMVPTIDIDLVWHTHQTQPVRYCEYTKSLLGKILNHDDTIGSDDLGKGAARYN